MRQLPPVLLRLAILGDNTIATSADTILDHNYVFVRTFVEGL